MNNGAAYPCAVCGLSPRNTVHHNLKQFGFHQWTPKEPARPPAELVVRWCPFCGSPATQFSDMVVSWAVGPGYRCDVIPAHVFMVDELDASDFKETK